MDGLEVFRKIRKEYNLLLSARNKDMDKIIGLEIDNGPRCNQAQ